jgi:hypothetical protein
MDSINALISAIALIATIAGLTVLIFFLINLFKKITKSLFYGFFFTIGKALQTVQEGKNSKKDK